MAKNNMVRARVSVRGTRPLLQHAFGPDSIPLEAKEKAGVAGNDPTEWKRSCMVTVDGQLYIRGTYVFGCLRNAAKHTKKGRGSIQPLVAATLQVEEPIILLDRWMPKKDEPPLDPTNGAAGHSVYIDVSPVRNPATKGRNIRYRLATSLGWKCAFTITWDKTLVSREQMRAVLNHAGTLAGFGDGLSVGNGRFEVISYEELTDAEETSAAGSMASDTPDHLGKGRQKVRSVREAVEVDGIAIDHRVSGKLGTNKFKNLRTLCRRCHVLRACHRHQGMIAKALADGIIPPNWPELVWEG